MASVIPDKYGIGDIHETVRDLILSKGSEPVLDVGCGMGRLCRCLIDRGVAVIGLDCSVSMLAEVPGSRVLGDARSIPFRDHWFGAAAALYMLYYLQDPRDALRECHRVLRPGGLFVAGTPSRENAPELHRLLPPKPSTFDAEDAPDMVREFFEEVEVQTWDGPYTKLPDQKAVEEYLFGRGVAPEKCREMALSLGAPLSITNRGCLVWGRAVG
jgi:SAM-dependent methyltransferase